MKKLITILVAVSLFGCTENQRARTIGGSFTVDLPKGQVFKNAAWKEHNLWVLTEDTLNKQHIFKEYSSFGILEGEVIIKQK